jgi:hypothetical protein
LYGGASSLRLGLPLVQRIDPIAHKPMQRSGGGTGVCKGNRVGSAGTAYPISRILPPRTYRNSQKAVPLSRTSR